MQNLLIKPGVAPILTALISCCLPIWWIAGCQTPEVATPKSAKIQFEKLEYYIIHDGDTATRPYKSRINYYFNNGFLHRWIVRDSLDRLLTDYVAEYDDNWVQTGARYLELEPGENFNGKYEIERVTFSGDSIKTTEWLDSTGHVYYQMVEELNKNGKPLRAAFIGEEVHGYDYLTYTPEGFEERIFFTNTNGRVFNDRTFRYIAINKKGDWYQRLKIMGDTVREVQVKSIQYYGEPSVPGKYLEAVISTATNAQNSISFSENGEVLFYTQGQDWTNQQAFMATKQAGLFTLPQKIESLDSLYNGAISPSGNRIIYCRRGPQKMDIYLVTRENDRWSVPQNLTLSSGLEGGYFNWADEDEIYFYTPKNGGDLVRGRLRDQHLQILDSLPEINTKATEFSPYLDRHRRFLIFTRFLEDDPEQQGFFISYNQGREEQLLWGPAQKIDTLPYGWGAFISIEQQNFFYTDGENIYSVPLSELEIEY